REIDALLHPLAHALEHEKRRMPLVHVPDRGRKPESIEDAHPADAEHDLLIEPYCNVSSIEAVRDPPVALAVFGHIGVEEIKRYVAGARPPNAHGQRAPRQLDGNAQLVSVTIRQQRYGQL